MTARTERPLSFVINAGWVTIERVGGTPWLCIGAQRYELTPSLADMLEHIDRLDAAVIVETIYECSKQQAALVRMLADSDYPAEVDVRAVAQGLHAVMTRH